MKNILLLSCTIFLGLPVTAADNRMFFTYKKQRLYHLVPENQREQKAIMPPAISNKNNIAVENSSAKNVSHARIK